ncbi:MAG: ABC transporter permease [Gemmataceae bacterium]
MSSNTAPEKNDDRHRPTPLSPARVAGELAPSVMRDDDLAVPRAVGTVAAAVVLFGGMALAMNLYGWTRVIDTGWSLVVLAVGIAGLLYHAAFDRDIQFRRLYMTFGLASLVFGATLALVSAVKGYGHLLPWSIPLLLLGTLFYLCFHRNETDDPVRDSVQMIVGVLGGSLGVAGLVPSIFFDAYFLPTGFVLAVAGLLLLAAYVSTSGAADDRAYRAALLVAAVGAGVALLVFGRTLFTATGSTFFVATGYPMLLVAVGYVAVGLGLSLDWPFFVLTRRELASFFLSPVAYISLFAFCVCAWIAFLMFVSLFDRRPGRPDVVMPEPVLANYIISLFPVFVLLFVVPVLTMRLLSEEERTGTLEVLLTAPVDEPVVVLSKFFAGLIGYLVVWLPFGLILLAIPAAGGALFDYRPLFSFSLALAATGAMFISMGLFCSSLTKNQIGSGLLAFGGMLLLTFVFFIARESAGRDWMVILRHVSYLHAWMSALEGRVVLRELLFPLSMTVLFLFMTVKVLESRKWR